MLTFTLCAAGAGFLLSVGLVSGVRHWARRRMLLDYPNARSLHVHPTPRGGGIGIVVPIGLAIGLVVLRVPEARSASASLAAGGLLIAAVGLIDDVRGLPPAGRLFAHVIAGTVVVVGIGTWHRFVWPGLWSIDLGWAAVPWTLLLVVGLTNVYNFMDGIDGIAGGQAVVAGTGWVLAGQVIQEPLLTIAGAVIATASLGFLLFNWSPATIFMGDVGSSFLGFLLASLVIVAARRSPAIATAGLLFLWPFVFDSAFTFLRRVRRRENVFRAHRSHLYQRLVLTGVPHRTVALLYVLLAAIGVAVGHAVAREFRPASIAGGLLIAAIAGGLCASVRWRERGVPRVDGAGCP